MLYETHREGVEGIARLGYVLENMELYVEADSAAFIPCFHVKWTDDENKLYACIKLTEGEYFDYKFVSSKLNPAQIRALITYLQAKSKFVDCTNWELLLMLWNMNNSDNLIDENIKMPDYDSL